MKYMKIALEQAELAYENNEVPVGVVIVKDGRIIAKEYNKKETLKSALAHAEILAIEKASKVIGDWRLNGCEMYVTLEPCSMCISAIAQARISKLYIGTFNIDMGACGSVLNLLDYDMFNTTVEVEWLDDDKCSDILVDFFKKRRAEKTKKSIIEKNIVI